PCVCHKTGREWFPTPRSNPPGHLKGPSHETDLAQLGCSCSPHVRWPVHQHSSGPRPLLRSTVCGLWLWLPQLRTLQRRCSLRRVCPLWCWLLRWLAAVSRLFLSAASRRRLHWLLVRLTTYILPRNEKVRANLCRFARTIVPPGNVPPCWFAVAS